MIYKFKSRATADVIMMGPQGDHLLRLIGKQPSAQGVVQVKDLPAAIEALKQAVAADEAQSMDDDNGDEASNSDASMDDAVSLRQRVWPMVLMMTASQAEQKDVVWGV